MEEKSKQLEFEEGMQIGKKWGKAKKKKKPFGVRSHSVT